MEPPYAIGSVPSLSGHAIAYRWRSLPRVCRHRDSKPQGSSERVLPWQVTMDQFIFASLSHTHYWYEVGILKVPIYYWIDTASDPLDLVPSQIYTFTKSYAVRHFWTSGIAEYNSVRSFFQGLATDTLNAHVRNNTNIKQLYNSLRRTHKVNKNR